MRVTSAQSIMDIDAFHDIKCLVKETVAAINNDTPIDAQLACSHLDETLDYLHRRLQ